MPQLDQCHCWEATLPGAVAVQVLNRVVQSLNKHADEQGRDLMLILDQAPSHKSVVGRRQMHGLNAKQIGRVLLVQLPAGTTGVVQPLDVEGCIRGFLRRFQGHMHRWYISHNTPHTPVVQPTVRDAAQWVRLAWRELPRRNLLNGWEQTRITPPSWRSLGPEAAAKVLQEERQLHRENEAQRWQLSDMGLIAIPEMLIDDSDLLAAAAAAAPREVQVPVPRRTGGSSSLTSNSSAKQVSLASTQGLYKHICKHWQHMHAKRHAKGPSMQASWLEDKS